MSPTVVGKWVKDYHNGSVAELQQQEFGCTQTSSDHVYLSCGVTDLRKSIDGLASILQQRFRLDSFSNYLFVFCNRNRDKIKILCWQYNGFLLFYKRLENGKFKWPNDANDVKKITVREFRWLLDGLSMDQPKALKQVTASTIV